MSELGWRRRSECLTLGGKRWDVRKVVVFPRRFFNFDAIRTRRRCRMCVGGVVGGRWPVSVTEREVSETEDREDEEKKREMTCLGMLQNCPSFFVVGQNYPYIMNKKCHVRGVQRWFAT